MTARIPPQDYRATTSPLRTARYQHDMADAAAAVVDQLAAKWTNWRIELGFDEGRDDR